MRDFLLIRTATLDKFPQIDFGGLWATVSDNAADWVETARIHLEYGHDKA